MKFSICILISISLQIDGSSKDSPPRVEIELSEHGAIVVSPGRIVQKCRHGYFLIPLSDTIVGKSLHLYGEWSEFEVQLFAQIVTQGDVVYDIGANIGAFTIPLSHMVGLSGVVVAFEAQLEVFQLLGANVQLNGLLNVNTQHRILGRENGRVNLRTVNLTAPANFGGLSVSESLVQLNLSTHDAQNEVIQLTLDDFFEPAKRGGPPKSPSPTRCPALIKIDVEGMELEVLEGASKVIMACHPVLYVENNCVASSKALIQLIAGFGLYRLYWDVRPFFNHANFRENLEDVFTDALVSINMIAVPTREKRFSLRNYVEIRNAEGGYYLHEYPLQWKNTTAVITQHGDADGCVR